MLGTAPAELEEVDPVEIEVDLGADQAVGPAVVHGERAAEDRDAPAGVGASDEDGASGDGGRRVGRPARGEGPPGDGVGQSPMPEAVGLDVAVGDGGKVEEGAVSEAIPHLLLPEAVEAFDRGLEAGLPRGDEDRRDAQGQAEPCDAAEAVLGVVTGEDGVVVELRVDGKAEFPPVPGQRALDEAGGDQVGGPGANQAGVERDGVQDFDAEAALDDQAFHGVEAVHLGGKGGGVGEVPGAGRGRAADAPASVEQAAAFEDATDGADVGRGVAAFPERAMDRFGAVLAQIAVAEFTAQRGDETFGGARGAVGGASRAARPVGEVEEVQPAAAGTVEPSLDGPQGDAVAAGNGALRGPAANRRDDGPAPVGGGDLFDSWCSRKARVVAGAREWGVRRGLGGRAPGI